MFWLIPILTVNLLRVTMKATGKKVQVGPSVVIGSLLILLFTLSLLVIST